MILVDIGPLVALFDPKDEQQNRCRRVLKEIRRAILPTGQHRRGHRHYPAEIVS